MPYRASRVPWPVRSPLGEKAVAMYAVRNVLGQVVAWARTPEEGSAIAGALDALHAVVKPSRALWTHNRQPPPIG